MKKLICIILVTLMLFLTGCSAKPVFRNVSWGMSKADVVKAETVGIDQDAFMNNDYWVTFEKTEVYDMPAYFVYVFDDDEKLCIIYCYFEFSEQQFSETWELLPMDPQPYLDCYDKLIDIMSEEYGEPISTERVDDKFSNDEYKTVWENEETHVTVGISGLLNQKYISVMLFMQTK